MKAGVGGFAASSGRLPAWGYGEKLRDVHRGLPCGDSLHMMSSVDAEDSSCSRSKVKDTRQPHSDSDPCREYLPERKQSYEDMNLPERYDGAGVKQLVQQVDEQRLH